MLMRRCFEAGLLGGDARVDVLLTKWDLVVSRIGDELATETLKNYRELFLSKFGVKADRLRVLPVAARPHYSSPLPLGFGLDGLIRSWADELPTKWEPVCPYIPVPARLGRSIDLFAIRNQTDLYRTLL